MSDTIPSSDLIEKYLFDYSKTLHNIYGTLLSVQESLENINRRVNRIEESKDSEILLDFINKRLASIQNILQSNSENKYVGYVQNSGLEKC